METQEVLSEALAGLLGEFRQGDIGDRRSGREEAVCAARLSQLNARWDARFGPFPECRLRNASFRGVQRRGVRDAYLKRIIIDTLSRQEDLQGATILNPVCVFGRHGRDLARALKQYKVVATDIDGRSNRIYGHLPRMTPWNYQFHQDNIFEPAVRVEPAAVVFFGACGSLSDAAMDYAAGTDARYVMCRTCCHENVGQNTRIVKRPNLLNRLFRMKNFVHARVSARREGYYFSSRYAADSYPRSRAARAVVATEEYMEVARNTVDSDICRGIIDLDRCLWLVEQGYDVWYKGELFFAEKGAGGGMPVSRS